VSDRHHVTMMVTSNEMRLEMSDRVARIIERLLGVVAGGVVFAIWLYIVADMVSIGVGAGLSGVEWFLLILGIWVFTLVMLLAGVYAVDATREDV